MGTVVSRFVCVSGVVVEAPTAFDGETNACDTPTATRSRRATVLFIIFFFSVEQCVPVGLGCSASHQSQATLSEEAPHRPLTLPPAES